MQFASATTLEQDIETATHALVHQIGEQFSGCDVDLALLFMSPHFADAAQHAVGTLRTALTPSAIIGCTAQGIIGHEMEVEAQAAMTLITAHLPGVELKPFAFHPEGLDAVLDDASLFLKSVAAPSHPALFVLIGDAYSMQVDRALNLFNTFYADVPVVGGIASAPQDQNLLLFNDRILSGGAVGVAFAGALDVDVIVSSGCRAVGPLFTVTDARENIIYGLDGLPALVRLQDLAASLSERDRASLQDGLFVGLSVVSEFDEPARGDFLIRGLMGVDEHSGAMAITDIARRGDTIRFHVRDASAASEDLELMLSPQTLFGPPSGALLFTCNGRGTQLYGYPNGDVSTIQQFLGSIPLAGLFCAGEIGPIAGHNHVHGQAASLAIFRPPPPDGRF